MDERETHRADSRRCGMDRARRGGVDAGAHRLRRVGARVRVGIGVRRRGRRSGVAAVRGRAGSRAGGRDGRRVRPPRLRGRRNADDRRRVALRVPRPPKRPGLGQAARGRARRDSRSSRARRPHGADGVARDGPPRAPDVLAASRSRCSRAARSRRWTSGSRRLRASGDGARSPSPQRSSSLQGGAIVGTGQSAGCPGLPLCDARSSAEAAGIHSVHRVAATALVFAFLWTAWQDRRLRGAAFAMSIAVAVVALAQFAVGVSAVWLRLPEVLRVLHLGLAAAMWWGVSAQATFALLGRNPR